MSEEQVSKFKQPEQWIWDGWESIPVHQRKPHVATIQSNTATEMARVVERWYGVCGVCGASEHLHKIAGQMGRGEYKPETISESTPILG